MNNEQLENLDYSYLDGSIEISDNHTDYFSSFSTDSLKQYYKEISKIPLLSKEEEYELLLKAKENDKNAINKLLVSNLRLVASIAKRMCFNGNDILDAIQDGTLGLLKAIENYDINTKFRLSTYALKWIQGSIQRGQENDNLSSNMNEKINKIKRVKTDFFQKYGREPKTSELSRITGIKISKINEILYRNYETCSLTTINYETEKEFMDYTIDVEQQVLDSVYYDEFISKTSAILNIRESEIIALKYGFFDNKLWSLSDISKRLMISTERIRKIHDRALKNIITNKGSFTREEKDFDEKLEQFKKEESEMKFDITSKTPKFIYDECMSVWFNRNSFKIFTSKDKICVAIKEQYNNYIIKKRKQKSEEELIAKMSSSKIRLNLDITSFYDLFPCYNKEDIEKIVKRNKIMLYVIYKVHGKNLDEYNDVELTPKEFNDYNYVVNQIKMILNMKNTLLYKYADDYEKLVLIIYELTNNDLINSICGKIFTLKIVYPLITIEEISKMLNVSHDVINNILNNKKDINEIIINTINNTSKESKNKKI